MRLKRGPRFTDSFWRMWCEAQERESVGLLIAFGECCVKLKRGPRFIAV